ncbi:taste receptor type 2 member 40-like [Dendropsophus ebraccatus]|uniref:taste receptor type 2 member 40-like n=1 Tax=Dendropsophus ebraccatus TaxID=150705 RepID=UPI0038319A65
MKGSHDESSVELDGVQDLFGMSQVQYLVLLLIDSLALVTYIPGNIFLIVKNIQDIIKNRRRSPFLQLTLGVSGINILQGILKVLSTVFMTYIESTLLSNIYLTLCLVLTSCNLWFSTWLCVYYCLQTVQLKLRFYTSLQNAFPKMVPWLHVLSIMVSSVLGIPFILKISEDQSSNTTLTTLSSNATLNNTLHSNGLMAFVGSTLEKVSYVVSSIGFLLMFGSSMAIIISLCVNLRHIIPKKGGLKSQDTEAFAKTHALRMEAAKAVSSIAGVNVVLYAAVNILTSTLKTAIPGAGTRCDPELHPWRDLDISSGLRSDDAFRMQPQGVAIFTLQTELRWFLTQT